MALRKEVLSLYRRILKLSRNWKAIDPSQTAAEQEYMRTEARTLFEKNKYIRDEEEIKQHIHEGEARMEIALHYQIPYPRHVNFPQHMISPRSTRMKGSQRRLKQSRPIYVKSLDDDQ